MTEAPALRAIDALEGARQRAFAARSNFDHDDQGAPSRHDIEFERAEPEVPRQDAKAAREEQIGDGELSAPPDLRPRQRALTICEIDAPQLGDTSGSQGAQTVFGLYAVFALMQ